MCLYEKIIKFWRDLYVIKSIISFIHDLFNKRFMVNWINYLVHFRQQEISNQIKTRGFYSLFTFSREIYMCLYEKIIIYFKGEVIMRNILSIALLVYLVMSAISVGYSIWWLSIVAKEMRKTNKTINEINNTQIKG